MADALGTGGGVVSAVDHRLDQGAFLALTGGPLDVRTGVLHGPGTTALVTGTSATSPMSYSIAAHHWVTTRGAADGVYVGTREAAGAVPTTPTPGSNSRIDIIWARQADAGSTISPDASTGDEYGVTQGAAAVSPIAPAIPVGAVELARATVDAIADRTDGAGVTITNTARLTVARGAPVPVRSQAERDALTTFTGLHVTRLDLGGVIQRWVTGTTWRSYVSEDELTAATAETTGNLALASGWNAFPDYNAPGWHLSADGKVTLRGMVRRSGAAVVLPIGGTGLVVATLPTAIRPPATVSPLCYVGLGLAASSYPARLYAPMPGTELRVVGMNSGAGTFDSDVGYINLDGAGWYL